LTLPNFILIGAAKAGTTALYWYLAEHPDVYMSPVKETFYFAYGLDESGKLLYGDPQVHRFPIKTRADYEALFAGAKGQRAIGEASPIYLECPQAPDRIQTAIPDVRLLCSLRHPVDRAYSDYVMYLRRRGRSLDLTRDHSPDAPWSRPDSRWMAVSRYGEQLARYYERFPREQIRVILTSDLKRTPVESVQALYRFLGIDPSFTPDFGTPHNVGGTPALPLLEKVFTNPTLRAGLDPLMPKAAADWLRKLRTRTMRQAPSLPADLRAELTLRFKDDILRTSELIGRDLSHWL